MRLIGITIRKLGPFRHFGVDLTAFAGARLIAICGTNGAGKSTFLELGIPGACYRQTPTRGSLMDLATDRDAMLEVRLSHGGDYTIRHLVDPVSKKSEAVVLKDGAPVLDSTKVKDFDRWAAEHLPPPEVLFSSVFAPQGAGGFLAMKPSERKTVLLRVLGVERLEALAEQARKRRDGARGQVETLQARIADERSRGGDVGALAAELAEARTQAGWAKEELEFARQALGEATAEAERVRELQRERDQRREQLGAARGQAEALQRELQELDGRIANNRAVLADAEAIRAAVARAEELRREIELAKAAEADERAQERAARARLASCLNAAAASEAQAEAAEKRMQRSVARLADRDMVARAAANLPGAESERDTLEAAWLAAEKELERVRGQRLAGAEERIQGLRGALSEIAEDRADSHVLAPEIAAGALKLDDDAVEAAASQPYRLSAAEQESRAAYKAFGDAQKRLLELQTQAAGAEQVEAAEADLASARGEIETSRATAADHRKDAAAAQQAAARHQESADEHNRTLAKLVAEQQQLEPMARKAEPLSRAEARLAELEPAAKAKRDELRELQRRCTELEPDTDEPPVPQLPDLAAITQQVRRHEGELLTVTSAVAIVEKLLEGARSSAARLEELATELQSAEAELSDWTRLADDLGKNGLQALEIDAAGPELTELVNDLLRTCHGPRFTLRVDTQRASADGKRLIEGCEVMVLDTKNGREAAAETFSGGERVILSEAMSLALSMLACRRSGITGITLVRDESGAALDTENGRAWVAMLRRAVEVTGAEQLLFVSHNPELQDLADARIEITDSNISSGELPQAAE